MQEVGSGYTFCLQHFAEVIRNGCAVEVAANEICGPLAVASAREGWDVVELPVVCSFARVGRENIDIASNRNIVLPQH